MEVHIEDRRQLNVRVPRTLLDALKNAARAEGETESVIVRRVLRAALAPKLELAGQASGR